MKTKSHVIRIVLAATIFGALASLAQAGAGQQFWTHTTPITTTKEAEAVKPGDTLMMACSACKTVQLTEYKSPLPNGRATPQWLAIGSTHTCEHCGGEITVVKGKTADSMQHNCSKCGEGAAFCCVAMGDDSGAKK